MAITPGLALRVMTRDRFRCVYCLRGAEDGVELTIDHVVPQVWYADPRRADRRDADAPSNLVTACGPCNSRKRDMNLPVYAHYLRERFGADTRALVARVRAAVRRPLPEA
ncbi:MAG: HNH endonuclease [Polyangiales bacterium]